MFVSSEGTIGYTGGVLFVGISSIVQLPAIPFQNSVNLQYINGQTIYIGGASTSSFASGRLWGVTTAPTLNYQDYSGSLYFTASGVTATISWDKTLRSQT